MNVAEALLTALKDHGVQQIFGLPGDFALPMFKVIEQSKILPLYTLSHEPGVCFAADGAARMLGAPSAIAVTYGAGALNAVNGVASAYAEKSPLVVISAAPGTKEGRGGLLLHHQVKSLDSQFALFREITCDEARLSDPLRAPAGIARVLASCLAQSRPVYIELPRDMVNEPCKRVERLPPPEFDAEAVAACADEIMQRLARAQRPVMMVGVETRRFGLEAQVADLARRLHVPVVTSFMGRGLLAGGDTPLLGSYIGMAGKPELTKLVDDSDCLLLMGVIMSDTNFGISEKRITPGLAIGVRDRSVTMGYHLYPNIPLAALVAALAGRVADREPRTLGSKTFYPTGMKRDAEPITPSDVSCGINDLFAAHGRMPMATDVGDCMFVAFEVDNTELVMPGYYATMGFGVPAGLGVQAASGRRTLILIGDGAFQMTGWELGNCRRYGWDPIVIVMNNLGWEMLRIFQPDTKFSSLDDWHYAEIAAPLGGDGVRVTTRKELGAALDKAAQTRGRFQLIEVMLPKGSVSATLARFVAGIARTS